MTFRNKNKLEIDEGSQLFSEEFKFEELPENEKENDFSVIQAQSDFETISKQEFIKTGDATEFEELSNTDEESLKFSKIDCPDDSRNIYKSPHQDHPNTKNHVNKNKKNSRKGNYINTQKQSQNRQTKNKQKKLKINKIYFRESVDVSNSLIHQSDVPKDLEWNDKSPFFLIDHFDDFTRFEKKKRQKKNMTFFTFDCPFVTKHTFIRLNKQNLIIAANDPTHPQYKSEKNLLKVFRQASSARSKNLEFEFICVHNMPRPVIKLQVNKWDDLLIVHFDDDSMTFFDMSFRMMKVGHVSDMYTIRLEEVSIKTTKNKKYQGRSSLLIKTNLQKSLKSMKKNEYISHKKIPYTQDLQEYLLIYNKTARSLELYNLDSSTKIECCLQYRLSNLPFISKIIYLENDYICLGSGAQNIKHSERNLVLMSLKTFEFSYHGWDQLDSVSDMVYDPFSGMLFVANETRYFSALKFYSKVKTLSLFKHFTLDSSSNRRVSFMLVRPSKTETFSKLLVFNKTNYMHTYLIIGNGKSIKFNDVIVDNVISPFQLTELSLPTIDSVNIKIDRRVMLIETNRKKLSSFCSISLGDSAIRF